MSSFKAQKAAAPAAMPGDGRAVNITDKVVLGAAPGIGAPQVGDTIDYLLPGGARLADLFFVADPLDTNGSPTLAGTIGYRPVNAASALAPSTNYFAASISGFRAGGRQQMSFKPIKFEEDVYVQFVITAVSATLAAGSEVHMVADVNAEGMK